MCSSSRTRIRAVLARIILPYYHVILSHVATFRYIFLHGFRCSSVHLSGVPSNRGGDRRLGRRCNAATRSLAFTSKNPISPVMKNRVTPFVTWCNTLLVAAGPVESYLLVTFSPTAFRTNANDDSNNPIAILRRQMTKKINQTLVFMHCKCISSSSGSSSSCRCCCCCCA